MPLIRIVQLPPRKSHLHPSDPKRLAQECTQCNNGYVFEVRFSCSSDSLSGILFILKEVMRMKIIAFVGHELLKQKAMIFLSS